MSSATVIRYFARIRLDCSAGRLTGDWLPWAAESRVTTSRRSRVFIVSSKFIGVMDFCGAGKSDSDRRLTLFHFYRIGRFLIVGCNLRSWGSFIYATYGLSSTLIDSFPL